MKKQPVAASQTEDQFLAEAVKRIWNELPETRYCFYHIASEAKRTPIEWVQLKAKGFINGIPDVQFIFSGTIYNIELKHRSTGTISADQAVVHCAHFNQGFPTYIFYDSETLFNFVEDVVKRGEVYTRSMYAKYHSPYCLPISEMPRLLQEAKRQDALKKQRYQRKRFR